MSGGGRLFIPLCWTAVACSATTSSAVVRQVPEMAEPATSTPTGSPAPLAAIPAADSQPAPGPSVPGGSADPPQSMRLVAVTDASDVALRPRLEGVDEIVVPLPAERAHLANVEVSLLVTRRDTGEIMDLQKKVFSGQTRGPALRFYLPPLPGGDYVAEIRATSAALMVAGGTPKDLEVPEKSQVSFRSQGEARSSRRHEFTYHFELHHAADTTPTLIPDEASGLEAGREELSMLLQNNEVVKVTLDCWASSDGESNFNMWVSLKRCEWIHKHVLPNMQNFKTSIEMIEASHGEDNPPVPEPAGIAEAELREIQKQNRVVILRVYTTN